MTTTADIEDMIARVAIGDRKAFEALYDATRLKLFGVCLRVLKNRAEAEDALQDAYIKIWRNADRYSANGFSPMTWLITVTRNLCIDRIRARIYLNGDMDEVAQFADDAPGPEAQAVAGSERARIVACMDELEPEKATAVRRAYLEGATYQELSIDLDVPLNTIRTWLRRSLAKLRACLSDDG